MLSESIFQKSWQNKGICRHRKGKRIQTNRLKLLEMLRKSFKQKKLYQTEIWIYTKGIQNNRKGKCNFFFLYKESYFKKYMSFQRKNTSNVLWGSVVKVEVKCMRTANSLQEILYYYKVLKE